MEADKLKILMDALKSVEASKNNHTEYDPEVEKELISDYRTETSLYDLKFTEKAMWAKMDMVRTSGVTIENNLQMALKNYLLLKSTLKQPPSKDDFKAMIDILWDDHVVKMEKVQEMMKMFTDPTPSEAKH